VVSSPHGACQQFSTAWKIPSDYNPGFNESFLPRAMRLGSVDHCAGWEFKRQSNNKMSIRQDSKQDFAGNTKRTKIFLWAIADKFKTTLPV
jgi:hypothetical protein